MQSQRARAVLAATLLFVLALATGAFVPTPTRAVELPPPNSPIFIQTNGPLADIGLGDWYTSLENGRNGGYHYFTLTVPCRWPADRDLDIDLFSPEINTYLPTPRPDEVEGLPLDDTAFELYGVGTQVVPPAQPSPGAPSTLAQRGYTPVENRGEQWERFHTLTAPVQCGSYILRAETKGNEQNGWRLRLGTDNDDDPNNPLPPNYDNPDNRPGSGDEPIIGIIEGTYQHYDIGDVQCLTVYEFVQPGLDKVSFHNFDLDGNERVSYYPPSTEYRADGLPTPGSFSGTVSTNKTWNNGTQISRGTGDVITTPEPGWWRLVTCVLDDNQFNQEGQPGVPSFRQPVPAPDVVVRKDDGRTRAAPGDILTYRITFFNQALTTRDVPGAAFDVTLVDTLPPNTSYRGCRIVTANLAGGCAQQGNTVTFTIDEPVFAGEGGEVEVTVQVNSDARELVENLVTLDYTDLLDNRYPTERSRDIDTLPDGKAPEVSATKAARLTYDPNRNGKADRGDEIEYTIVVRNSGAGAAFDVTVSDTPDQHTRLMGGSVRLDPAGAVLQGNISSHSRVEARFDTIAPGAAARVFFVVKVNPNVPDTVTRIANQGTVRGANLPPTRTDDPSTPAPGDPTVVPYSPPGKIPPTAIELLDFSASREGAAVVVRWTTGSEIETAGFQLYRANSADRATAVQVTAGLIVARGGPATGATYSWADPSASPGTDYHYWLVEVETSGATNQHGPARVDGPAPTTEERIYLPLIVR